METAYGSIHKSVHGAGHDVVVRILTTCEQMLRDRGCADVQVLRDARACFDVEDTSPAITGRGGTRGDDYDVYVHSEERVSVKAARAILERSNGVRAIVVSVEGPTPFTRRECDGQPVQFFTARELCVNVSRHRSSRSTNPSPTGAASIPSTFRRSPTPTQSCSTTVGPWARWCACGGCLAVTNPFLTFDSGAAQQLSDAFVGEWDGLDVAVVALERDLAPRDLCDGAPELLDSLVGHATFDVVLVLREFHAPFEEHLVGVAERLAVARVHVESGHVSELPLWRGKKKDWRVLLFLPAVCHCEPSITRTAVFSFVVHRIPRVEKLWHFSLKTRPCGRICVELRDDRECPSEQLSTRQSHTCFHGRRCTRYPVLSP